MEGVPLPGEVEWLGGELLRQVGVGQARVDNAREKLADVNSFVSRVKDNQELVLKQRRLLEGQQDAMFDMKQLATRVQSDNEALRVEHAQLRKMKEQAAAQLAENNALELRHRKQLEAQAELVSGVRQDLLALSAENTELRKASQELKILEDSHRALHDDKSAVERRHKDEVLSLRKEQVQLQQTHSASVMEEAEKYKKLVKEHRFKMLRTQQQHQQLETDSAETLRQLDALQQQHTTTLETLNATTSQLEELRLAHNQLQARFQEQSEMHEHSPGAVDARKIQEKDETINSLMQRLEETEATSAMQQLQASRREQNFQDASRTAKAHAELMEEESQRHRQHAQESGERADSLAAKLAMAEASLSAKDELLRTRTERLRIMSANAGNPTPPDQSLGGEAGGVSDTERRLREELDALRNRYTALEQTAKKKLDRSYQDCMRLEEKVEQLLTSELDEAPD